MPDELSYDVFLRHSAKDKQVVRDVAERLKKDGLEQSRVLLLRISPTALASGWLALERSTAVNRDLANAGRRFIPLMLGDCARDLARHGSALFGKDF